MYKYLILFVIFGLLIGCNQSSLEPKDENLQPENVSFNDENNSEDPVVREERLQVPVNPGREQNIFEDATPNQWFGFRDRNEQADQQTEQPNQRQQEQQNQESSEQNKQTPSFDGEALDDFRQKVIELTNEARSENGAKALS